MGGTRPSALRGRPGRTPACTRRTRPASRRLPSRGPRARSWTGRGASPPRGRTTASGKRASRRTGHTRAVPRSPRSRRGTSSHRRRSPTSPRGIRHPTAACSARRGPSRGRGAPAATAGFRTAGGSGSCPASSARGGLRGRGRPAFVQRNAGGRIRRGTNPDDGTAAGSVVHRIVVAAGDGLKLALVVLEDRVEQGVDDLTELLDLRAKAPDLPV